MLNLRYIGRLLTAFIKRFKGILIIGIIFGVVVFVGMRFAMPYLTQKKVEEVGLTGRYSIYNLPNDILSLVGDGLTKLDKSGAVVPDLATSWEQKDNGKIWTFHLRGISWQDGSKLVSSDIEYNFGDVSIERPDKHTIIFKLNSIFAPFPTVVAHPVFKKGLLGTGEWKVMNLSVVGSYVAELKLQDKDGNVKIFKFYPSEERTKLAYKLGEVNELQDITDIKPFEAWKTVNIKPAVNEDRYVAVFFNTSDNILSDKDLRQALSYAINKNDLSNDRAYGPISPNSWAYNAQLKPYDYDVERAKELIAKSKIDNATKKDLKIKLVATPVLLNIAEKIAKNWEEVGVKTTVQVVSVLPPDYQAFLVTYDIPKDPDQYSTWHSKDLPTNISHYENPRISKLLEDGRLELDSEQRKKIYLDFQRFLVEDAPAAFLYHPISYTITRK